MPEDLRPVSGRAILTFACVSALSGGCSLIFHADAEQCSSTSDCTARGPSFAGRVCVAGECVVPEAQVSLDGAADSTTTVPPDAGVDAGPIVCQSPSDCPIPRNTNLNQVSCDVDRQACVTLNSDTCPTVIGDYRATTGVNPIFIGAFATLPAGAPLSHPSYLNYALAQADFASQGGIQRGSGALRMPVIIVCDDSTDAIANMDHLVNDVHVPGVIAALPSASLRQTFSSVNPSGTANPIFFVNPFGADSTLTALPTMGLLWHMLGQPLDVAPAYGAYFPLVEAYVRSTQGLGSSTPMKVATVTAQSTDTLDLAKAVKPLLTWNNGASSAATSDCTGSNYCDVQIAQSSLDGYVSIDDSSAVSALIAFRPNVVVSFASEEFIDTLTKLEIPGPANPAPTPKPFYLVGPYNHDSLALLTWILHDDTKRTRVAGINFASAQNNTVLNDYVAHFDSVNSSAALGAENYYDAAYFTIYSLVAAGQTPILSGSNLATGMGQLISPFNTAFDVGPADIGDITQQLTTGHSISLVGTLGPPDFAPSTGARISQGDVYCVGPSSLAREADGGFPTAFYDDDVLRLTADGGAVGNGGPDGGPSALQGTFPCYSGM